MKIFSICEGSVKFPKPKVSGITEIEEANRQSPYKASVGLRIKPQRRLPSDGSLPDTVQTLPFRFRRRRLRFRSDCDISRHPPHIRSFGNIGLVCPQIIQRRRRRCLYLSMGCLSPAEEDGAVQLSASIQ